MDYAKYVYYAPLICMAEFYWDLDNVYSAYDEAMPRIGLGVYLSLQRHTATFGHYAGMTTPTSFVSTII